MIITNAKSSDSFDDTHLSIQATINGEAVSVPLDPNNRHYAEILKQVADGDLTIADAD